MQSFTIFQKQSSTWFSMLLGTIPPSGFKCFNSIAKMNNLDFSSIAYVLLLNKLFFKELNLVFFNFF